MKGEKNVQPTERPGDRVKKIRKKLNLSREQLAEMVHCSPDLISAIEQNRRNLTVDRADELAEQLHVRKEYLLCFDDYETNAARFGSVILATQHDGDLLHAGLSAFASLRGYEIILPDLSKTLSIEEVISDIKGGFKIIKGEKKITLSADELNGFENEVCDFVELKLKHLFAQKGITAND